jgi:bifunctional DNase/RNase
MRRKELKILGLSYSQSQVGSYVVVLSDRKGKRKLPIIIKSPEAQKIALELEGIKSIRPLTHDLIKSMTDSFGIDVQEVFIFQLLEGIFYTKIVLSNGLDEVEIECGLGDALALSTIYKCPIFTTTDILETAGVIMNDDGTVPEEDIEEAELDENDEIDELLDFLEEDDKPSKRVVSIPDLEKLMIQAIENEEYEIAAELRDRIQKLKEEE